LSHIAQNIITFSWLFLDLELLGKSGGDSYSGWLGVKFRVNKKSASFIDIKIESGYNTEHLFTKVVN
jgi:hypothetical protein